jgi:hypothetical protein
MIENNCFVANKTLLFEDTVCELVCRGKKAGADRILSSLLNKNNGGKFRVK